MLNKNEFNILKLLKTKSSQNITQREMASAVNCSLGTISKTIKSMIDKNYIDHNYEILKEGNDELDLYKVKNAIILAAGISSDNDKISKNIPKGLYIVKDEILIERIIEQLKSAEIENIYVVVGFRMDQFFYLEEKYGVKIVVNRNYKNRNNNGSIKCVEHLLGNSYIVPNDEYFTENPFSQYEFSSYYSVVYSETFTKETFVKMDNKERITGVYNSGDKGWGMIGPSFLNNEFAEKYCRYLNDVYDLHDTKKMFWEEIFYTHLQELELYAKKYPSNVIYEFDELEELEGFDNQFFNNINPEIYDIICSIFNSSENEITDIKPYNNNGVDNYFEFKVRNDSFIFRYPCEESEKIINYAIDKVNNVIAYENGLDESYVFSDRNGYKVDLKTERIENISISKCVELYKKFNNNIVAHSFDFREQIRTITEFFNDNQKMRMNSFSYLQKRIDVMLNLVENDNWDKQFSHNMISIEKFRLSGKTYGLTDWTFSGVNDIGYDIAALSCIASKSNDFDNNILKKFIDVSSKAKRHLYACQAISSYYKFLLGIYYSESSNEYSDTLYENWRNVNYYLNKAEEILDKKENDYLTNENIKYIENKINSSILSVKPLAGGVTNNTYEITTNDNKKYAVRIPGTGTNEYINRKDEMSNISDINFLGIVPEVISADEENGILILDYVNNCQPCSIEDIHNRKSLERICRQLCMIHKSEIRFNNEFDIVKMQENYRKHLKELGGVVPEILKREEENLDSWMSYLFLNYPKKLVACHIDPKLNNFLKKGMKLYLIDWEYSGMADMYFELANFTLTNNLSPEEEKLFIESYCKVSGINFEYEKYLLYKFATDYLWIYWHLIKCQQNSMIEYNEMSWKKRFGRIKNVLDILERK